MKLSFGTLPARVTEGSVDESTVSITDNDTRGVTITPTALSIVELAWDDYTVVLDSEPTGEVTITITDPTDQRGRRSAHGQRSHSRRATGTRSRASESTFQGTM